MCPHDSPTRLTKAAGEARVLRKVGPVLNVGVNACDAEDGRAYGFLLFSNSPRFKALQHCNLDCSPQWIGGNLRDCDQTVQSSAPESAVRARRLDADSF